MPGETTDLNVNHYTTLAIQATLTPDGLLSYAHVDEALIKKQFKKIALSQHADKDEQASQKQGKASFDAQRLTHAKDSLLAIHRDRALKEKYDAIHSHQTPANVSPDKHLFVSLAETHVSTSIPDDETRLQPYNPNKNKVDISELLKTANYQPQHLLKLISETPSLALPLFSSDAILATLSEKHAYILLLITFDALKEAPLQLSQLQASKYFQYYIKNIGKPSHSSAFAEACIAQKNIADAFLKTLSTKTLEEISPAAISTLSCHYFWLIDFFVKTHLDQLILPTALDWLFNFKAHEAVILALLLKFLPSESPIKQCLLILLDEPSSSEQRTLKLIYILGFDFQHLVNKLQRFRENLCNNGGTILNTLISLYCDNVELPRSSNALITSTFLIYIKKYLEQIHLPKTPINAVCSTPLSENFKKVLAFFRDNCRLSDFSDFLQYFGEVIKTGKLTHCFTEEDQGFLRKSLLEMGFQHSDSTTAVKPCFLTLLLADFKTIEPCLLNDPRLLCLMLKNKIYSEELKSLADGEALAHHAFYHETILQKLRLLLLRSNLMRTAPAWIKNSDPAGVTAGFKALKPYTVSPELSSLNVISSDLFVEAYSKTGYYPALLTLTANDNSIYTTLITACCQHAKQLSSTREQKLLSYMLLYFIDRASAEEMSSLFETLDNNIIFIDTVCFLLFNQLSNISGAEQSEIDACTVNEVVRGSLPYKRPIGNFNWLLLNRLLENASSFCEARLSGRLFTQLLGKNGRATDNNYYKAESEFCRNHDLVKTKIARYQEFLDTLKEEPKYLSVRYLIALLKVTKVDAITLELFTNVNNNLAAAIYYYLMLNNDLLYHTIISSAVSQRFVNCHVEPLALALENHCIAEMYLAKHAESIDGTALLALYEQYSDSLLSMVIQNGLLNRLQAMKLTNKVLSKPGDFSDAYTNKVQLQLQCLHELVFYLNETGPKKLDRSNTAKTYYQRLCDLSSGGDIAKEVKVLLEQYPTDHPNDLTWVIASANHGVPEMQSLLLQWLSHCLNDSAQVDENVFLFENPAVLTFMTQFCKEECLALFAKAILLPGVRATAKAHLLTADPGMLFKLCRSYLTQVDPQADNLHLYTDSLSTLQAIDPQASVSEYLQKLSETALYQTLKVLLSENQCDAPNDAMLKTFVDSPLIRAILDGNFALDRLQSLPPVARNRLLENPILAKLFIQLKISIDQISTLSFIQVILLNHKTFSPCFEQLDSVDDIIAYSHQMDFDNLLRLEQLISKQKDAHPGQTLKILQLFHDCGASNIDHFPACLNGSVSTEHLKEKNAAYKSCITTFLRNKERLLQVTGMTESIRLLDRLLALSKTSVWGAALRKINPDYTQYSSISLPQLQILLIYSHPVISSLLTNNKLTFSRSAALAIDNIFKTTATLYPILEETALSPLMISLTDPNKFILAICNKTLDAQKISSALRQVVFFKHCLSLKWAQSFERTCYSLDKDDAVIQCLIQGKLTQTTQTLHDIKTNNPLYRYGLIHLYHHNNNDEANLETLKQHIAALNEMKKSKTFKAIEACLFQLEKTAHEIPYGAEASSKKQAIFDTLTAETSALARAITDNIIATGNSKALKVNIEEKRLAFLQSASTKTLNTLANHESINRVRATHKMRFKKIIDACLAVISFGLAFTSVHFRCRFMNTRSRERLEMARVNFQRALPKIKAT